MKQVGYIVLLFTIILIVIFGLFYSPLVFSAKNYGAILCHKDPDDYACHKVKRKEDWESLFPEGEKLEMIRKLNRMNTELYPGIIIAVPKNMNVTVMDLSPFKKEIDPPGEKIILVSISDLAWGAYDEGGTLLRWGPISSGQDYCSDIGRGCRTGTGKFRIYQKEGFGCVSTKFPVGRGGAPMPYCMFFHGGYALHGSYEVPGYNASHGCIRLFVNDAKWLNQEFVGNEKVRVFVTRIK